jgi:hypothetical protein
MSSYIYAARRTPFGAGGAGQEPAGGVGARSAPPRAPLAPRREARGRDCSCLQCGMSCSDRRFRQFRHRPASPGRRTGRRRHRRRGLPRFMKPGRAALRPAKFESTSPLVARSSNALRVKQKRAVLPPECPSDRNGRAWPKTDALQVCERAVSPAQRYRVGRPGTARARTVGSLQWGRHPLAGARPPRSFRPHYRSPSKGGAQAARALLGVEQQRVSIDSPTGQHLHP